MRKGLNWTTCRLLLFFVETLLISVSFTWSDSDLNTNLESYSDSSEKVLKMTILIKAAVVQIKTLEMKTTACCWIKPDGPTTFPKKKTFTMFLDIKKIVQ